MKFKTIAIVGLGLMGGSLAAACRHHFPKSRIIGISRNRNALRFAKRKGWIHEGFRDLNRAMKSVGAGFPRPHSQGAETAPLHLIVLCTPVDTFQNYFRRIDRIAPKGTLVTDAGSVKGAVLHAVERRRWKRIQFVGAHPMVGSHERGIQAADPKLFDDALTFVTRSQRRGTARRAPTAAFKIVKNFWQKISSRVVVLSAKEHDEIASQISHLPHAVAACLVLAAQKKRLRFAGTGFRDTTRIAQGHPSIWVPIFRSNRKALERALRNFEMRLADFKKALRANTARKLERFLTSAARRRRAPSS